jgi:hypothetical protein
MEMNALLESDWKTYRAMVPHLRERHLADRNMRITRLLTDPRKTETERFWEAMEAGKNGLIDTVR